MKLQYFTDPGHGWVKVPFKLLKQLGIAEKISSYSYCRNDSVYLEEDCDLGALYESLISKGIKVELVQKHTNNRSKIRSYSSFAFNEK
jgi:hypothetical protein